VVAGMAIPALLAVGVGSISTGLNRWFHLSCCVR
jgi:hypothetical protein